MKEIKEEKLQDDILVSVIIPVYNSAMFIEEALDSVIKQTYRNLEIIVVDDCSTDGSGIICDRYAETDSRIKVIHHTATRGVCVSRNDALDVVTGGYVVFLDSDDAYHSEAIQRMVDSLIREDVDVVLCNFSDVITNGRFDDSLYGEVVQAGISGRFDHAQIMNALIDGKVSCVVWGKLYKADLWNGLRFPAGQVYEDLYLSVDYLDKAGSVFVMSETLLIHRIRKNSITTTVTAKNLSDYFLAHEHYSGYVSSHTQQLFNEKQLQKVLPPDSLTLIMFILRPAENREEKRMIYDMIKKEVRSFIKTDGFKCQTKKTKAKLTLIGYCPRMIGLLSPLLQLKNKYDNI